MKLARLFNVKEAILKQGSPPYCCGRIYNGTFSARVVEGYGIIATLLKRMVSASSHMTSYNCCLACIGLSFGSKLFLINFDR